MGIIVDTSSHFIIILFLNLCIFCFLLVYYCCVYQADVDLGIYGAVTRQTWDGNHPGGWIPTQKITVEEALAGYTRDSAYGLYLENKVGMLRAGMLADFVVLECDLRRIDEDRIPFTHVLKTVVGGRLMFEGKPGNICSGSGVFDYRVERARVRTPRNLEK